MNCSNFNSNAIAVNRTCRQPKNPWKIARFYEEIIWYDITRHLFLAFLIGPLNSNRAVIIQFWMCFPCCVTYIVWQANGICLKDKYSQILHGKLWGLFIHLSNQPYLFLELFCFLYLLVPCDPTGYKFPKNWKVHVWIRSIHIDPRYYDDPLAFNPDRWDVIIDKFTS